MLSPQKAAKRLGVSRQTVVNAIKAGKLKATRNNSNHWIIAAEDLEGWASTREQPPTPATSGSANSTQSDSANLHPKDVELARTQEQLKAAQDRVVDLEQQLSKRDADYREAMDMLRDAQRPLWFKIGKLLRGEQ